MTVPVIASRTGTSITSASALHTITLGAASAGDLILVVGSMPTGSSNLILVDEAFSGHNWNKAGTASSFTTGVAYWKVAQGSDALRLILTGSAQLGAYICFVITGHGSAVFSPTGANGFAATNADPPTVSITGSAQDVLYIAVAAFQGSTTASAAPSSYANLTSQTASSSAAVSVADRGVTSSTSDNPGAFTNASATWIAMSFAIPENAITTNARQTQEVIEAVNIPSPSAVFTHVPVEVVSSFANHMVVTQVALETLTPQTHNLYATQVAIEVLSGDPWPPASSNANKYRQIFIAC